MKIRVLGGGWYGCHIALALRNLDHEVELHEIHGGLFMGASGSNPARLHQGFHYPRSRLTRAACLDHAEKFMAFYGELTRAVPINLYAVARDSLVDFGTYKQVLAGEVPFIPVHDPSEYGLCEVEGALLTGERHIVIAKARRHFERELAGDAYLFCKPAKELDDKAWDWTIDCTFCALDAEAIDRYEPCVTALLEGPCNTAVTIMDGPFPSIYPWQEENNLSSLTSALLTPLSKTCRSWKEAQEMLYSTEQSELAARCEQMLDQISKFWPAARDLYKVVDYRTGVRAMPKSNADARLVDVVQVGERALRVRAGKIDAVFRAEALIRERIGA